MMAQAEPSRPAGAPRAVAVYNRYLNRGGEDDVFENDLRLLLRNGWSVVPVTTRTTVPRGLVASVRFAAETVWSRRWSQRFDAVLRLARPHVVHVVNVFPRISPSILSICRRHGVPVVQMVQNYRFGCPRATFYRRGAVCELCKGRRFPWAGVRYRCYHGSALRTATVGAMTAVHRALGTWRRDVALYVAASAFSGAKLVECGLPAEKVVVRPNFRDPDPGPKTRLGDYALFVGRLSAEKGVPTLLEAIAACPRIPFKLVGEGPLLDAARRFSQTPAGGKATVLGRRSNREVIDLMHGARCLVFPSEWYEGLPMTLVEAFACGLPVVVASMGASGEAVEHGVSGVHVPPGDSRALASALLRLWPDEQRLVVLGEGARRAFERSYTPAASYARLLEIYRRAGVALVGEHAAAH